MSPDLNALDHILSSPHEVADELCFEGVLSDAASKLASGDVKILSLDVWDTLLFRKVAAPVDVFLHQRDLLCAAGFLTENVSAREWQNLRIKVERTARTRRRREVTLAEIYEELEPFALTGFDAVKAADIEVRAEAQLSHIDPVVARLMDHAAANNVDIVLVSDFYMSAPLLTRVIAEAAGNSGVELPSFRHVFVSCDHASGKQQRLFDAVLKQLGGAREDILHIGDNAQADIGPAERRSIPALHYPQANEWQREIEKKERALLAPGTKNRNDEARASSLRRIVAKHLAASGAEEAALGAFVFGPFFFGFSNWLLNKLRQAGARDVYFLTREAHMLKPLMEATARRANYEIRCHVLPMSRRFARLVAIKSGRRHEITRLFDANRSYTLEDFLSVLGLQKSDLPKGAVATYFAREDAMITGAGQSAFLDRILSSRTVLKKAGAKIEEQKRLLREYLDARTPLTEQDQLHIVDLGWGGSIQRQFARYLMDQGLKLDLQGYYMGTTGDVIADPIPRSYYSSYIFEFGAPTTMFSGIRRSVSVYETATMPEHGSFLRFNGAEPVYEPVWAEDGVYSRIRNLQEGVCRFVALALTFDETETSSEEKALLPAIHVPRHVARAIAVRLMLFPTSLEAQRIGSLHFEENVGHRHSRAMAEFRSTKRRGLSQVAAVNFAGYSHDEIHWVGGFLRQQFGSLANFYGAHALGLLDSEDLSHLSVARDEHLENERSSSSPADALLQRSSVRARQSLQDIVQELSEHFDIRVVFEASAMSQMICEQVDGLTKLTELHVHSAPGMSPPSEGKRVRPIDMTSAEDIRDAVSHRENKTKSDKKAATACLFVFAHTASDGDTPPLASMIDAALRGASDTTAIIVVTGVSKGEGDDDVLETVIGEHPDMQALAVPHSFGVFVLTGDGSAETVRSALQTLLIQGSPYLARFEADRHEFAALTGELMASVSHLEMEIIKARDLVEENVRLKVELTELNAKYESELEFYGAASKYFQRALGFAKYVPGGQFVMNRLQPFIFYIAAKLEKFE